MLMRYSWNIPICILLYDITLIYIYLCILIIISHKVSLLWQVSVAMQYKLSSLLLFLL